MIQLAVVFYELAVAFQRASDGLAAEHYLYVGLSMPAFDFTSNGDIALGQCHIARVLRSWKG
jgi:hypothetical protein